MNRSEFTARLGRVGIWTRQLDMSDGDLGERAAAELEALGWQTLWIPEAIHREVLTHATLLLAATDRLVVATGIARVHARSPQAAALAQRHLNARFAGRFLLGLGVSHPMVVERMLGQQYGPPLATMRSYLDSMDATRGGAPAPAGGNDRVLAALGPQMLRLAAQRAGGAHTYVAPVAHTAWAREILGPDPFLAPCVKVVLTDDRGEGLDIARASVAPTIKNPAYRENVLRSGFDVGDIDDGVSDALVDALVAIGGEDDIAARVREHLAAGADHVCIEVLTGDDTTIPLDAWRRLAPLGVQP
ncbi:MAG: TIGR03620 family F420-dependent LLM class oxidoreductase [Actinomycetota bacterium]|nr:TIGR03620 family F420-dependent LLM class oxidoreductase [Actinomycetota bacterium]